MDFGQWGDPNGGSNNGNSTNKSVSQEQQQQTEQQQQKSTSCSTADGAEMMHQFEHAGVFCDVCNLTICGFRYKCLQCPDFDLCSSCERRGHHAGHVMMRIAFPEQAPEAIKRYFENQGTNQGANDESSAEEEGGVQGPEGPHAHPHHHGHGHGHHGKFRKHPHPHHHGKKSHKKWRKLESDSSDDDAAAGPTEAIPRVGCPYVMGKKEMKKYAKQMKKMAYMSKKAEKKGEAAGCDAEKGGKKHPGVDYSQCISQIQQYLNGFGIPIDVVTLYDEWGNGVATTNNQQAGATADPNSNNENVTNGAGASGPQPAGTSDLCDKLQNVRIDISGDAGGEAGTEEMRKRKRKAGDEECGGDWTMLDNQAEANYQNPVCTAAVASAPAPMDNTNNLNTDVTASMEPTSLDNGPVKTTWAAAAPAEVQATSPIIPAAPPLPQPQPPTNINPQTIPMPWHPVHMRTLPVSPFPPHVPDVRQFHPIPPIRPIPPPPHHHVPHHHHVPPTRPAPPPQSTGNASAPPLYPRIPFPPLMDFVHGVSNTVGSAIRNVQANLPAPPASPTSAAAAAAASGTQGDQLTPQMNATLNQLLSMGFSNHDGWLARLVQSKNGDMDAVLSALFDRGD